MQLSCAILRTGLLATLMPAGTVLDTISKIRREQMIGAMNQPSSQQAVQQVQQLKSMLTQQAVQQATKRAAQRAMKILSKKGEGLSLHGTHC
ncbi:hypothetical protein CHS0354_034727 [Potamilus streckersoni]|uniref:Uncharacterized protein n=1 Tax=Potamilus streckersoni TaxID=2493646 RepID=A0AAE0VXF6_9BIVA|nr:hypothetical protein CHS0354_034727 [Potamilus streckersoni]